MPETPRQPEREEFPVQSRYLQLGRAIGHGGVGIVFKAYDTIDGRLVAVKVLRAASRTSIDLLLNEVEWLRLAVHPAIGRLHSVETDDLGVAFLVMEFIDGESLAQIIKERPQDLTVERAITIGYQLASALQFLHDLEREVIHFDVKPSNVLVRADWSIKLIDFGMARSRLVPEGGLWRFGGITPPGFTWEYVAPEVAFGAEFGSIDKRADIWSFGLVLWECFAMARPFGEARGRSYTECAARSAPPIERLPELPRGVESLILRCLAKRPADRLRDIGEALPVLRDAQSSPGPRARRLATNLVGELTSFVGRNAEKARLAELLGANRVVALLGFPGVGRSRLARAVLSDVELVPRDVQGVVWVSLSALPVTDEPDEVERAVLSALRSVRWPSLRPPVEPAGTGEPLYRWLGDQQVLVVLDDIDAVAAQALVLAARLADSSARLLVIGSSSPAPGMASLALRGLRVPAASIRRLAELQASDAGELFKARAEATTGRSLVEGDAVRSVARIVRELDGNPLAIELAASELAVLSIDELEAQVVGLLDGSSTAPDRSPLDRMIDAVLDRLTDSERSLLARLRIFRGGWTRDAAYAVCADETDPQSHRPSVGGEPLEIVLRNLINRSLVSRDSRTRRYALNPLLRARIEALGDVCDSGDVRRCERARLRFLVQEGLGSNPPRSVSPDTNRLAILGAERENVLAALTNADGQGEEQTLALRLLRESAYVSWAAGHSHPFVAHFRRAAQLALDPTGSIDDIDLRIGLLNSIGIALLQADPALARRALEEGIRLATPDGPHAWRRYVFLTNLGLVEKHLGNVEMSIERQREALAELGAESRTVERDSVLLNLAVALKLLGRVEESRPILIDLEKRFAARSDAVRLANVRQSLGEISMSAGDIQNGFDFLRRSRHRVAPWDWRARRALWFGVGYAGLGEEGRARRLLSFGERMYRERGEEVPTFHLVHLRAALRVLDGLTGP